MNDSGTTHRGLGCLTEICKTIERIASYKEARNKVKSNCFLQVFPYSENYTLDFDFFLYEIEFVFFFSLQKYSYHNVTWWAAALWTQPGRNSSWTAAAAAKVWAHPFFIPFTLVNGVSSKPAMAILSMQPVVVNYIFFLKLKSKKLGNNLL